MSKASKLLEKLDEHTSANRNIDYGSWGDNDDNRRELRNRRDDKEYGDRIGRSISSISDPDMKNYSKWVASKGHITTNASSVLRAYGKEHGMDSNHPTIKKLANYMGF
jgi:hypothetical protein